MKMQRILFAATLVALGAGVTQAHHSFTQFDRENKMITSGTVVRWDFNNPHSWLHVNVVGDDGAEELWSFEGSAPTSLIQRGITGRTFEPGDTVTMMYCPMRDGRTGGHMGIVKLADGSYVVPADGGCSGNAEMHEQWKTRIDQLQMSGKDATH
ncbi:MAG: DUF6152 family protein [Gammaproteobacteria bacterium]|jgi:hypothetical protein